MGAVAPHPSGLLDTLSGVSPASVEGAETPDGYQAVAIVRPSLIVVRIHGEVQSGSGTSRVAGHLAQAIARGVGISVFFHLEGFRRYDTELRVRYTDAIRAHLDNVTRVWVYADSKLVKMGASVAGLVLPQLRLIDRVQFLALLEQELKC
jgi:hypothetical protein